MLEKRQFAFGLYMADVILQEDDPAGRSTRAGFAHLPSLLTKTP